MRDPIENVLMSLNPAGWVKTLGLLPFFAATRNDDLLGVQVTKELGARPAVHVRVKSPLAETAAVRRFVRSATAPHGWEEMK